MIENFIIFGSHIGYSRWQPLHNHFMIYHDITYIQKHVIIIIMKAKIIVTLYIKNVTGALYTVNYNENTLSVSVSVNI